MEAFWSIVHFLTLASFGLVSLLLILVVLIQKGRGGGLASAFGGGSGTATAFGSKTGDVLTWATSVIFGVFLLLAIGLNLWANNASAAKAKLTVPVPAGTGTTATTPDTTPGTTPLSSPTPAAAPTEAAPATTQP